MSTVVQNTRSSAFTAEERVSHTNRRFLADKIAAKVVALGGWIILLSICTIILVIFLETFPLFKPIQISSPVTYSLNSKPLLTIPDNHLEQVNLLTTDFKVENINIKAQGFTKVLDAPIELINESITTSVNLGDYIYVGTSSGKVVPLLSKYNDQFADGKRTSTSVLNYKPAYQVTNSQAISKLAVADTSSGQLFVASTNTAKINLYFIKTSTGFIRPATPVTEVSEYDTLLTGEITALTVDPRAEYLIVGSNTGELLALNLASGNKVIKSTLRKLDSAVTDLKFLQGGRTIVSSTADGQITSWQILKNSENKPEITQNYQFEKHAGSALGIITAQRNRVFLSFDNNNNIKIHFGSSGKTLKSFNANLKDQKIEHLALSPKGNGLWALTNSQQALFWTIDNPHPEISWHSLFSPVQYEGYKTQDHVWQSTGGTDAFEAKLGLMPLIFGTLKGAMYALLFALPLAFLSAIYTSLFMPPKLKAVVKPVLETMAALPSVVIGFVAGLWLAPTIEPHLFAILIAPIVLIISITTGCYITWLIQNSLKLKLPLGAELFISVIFVILAFLLTFKIGTNIESIFFSGSLKDWLYTAMQINVDQRNSIVAGIAVGFAVVPIIFTISEDCLTSVPRTLTAGSLALGANRWQTAIKVVLPVAAPGIFAAVMIGIGRAVGETMVVLMATGNTAIMSLSAFTGFRALSANIAVELPEAPVGSTLYRILFLTALILFLMTFVLNILSELVRNRLKKRLSGAH